MEQRLLILGAGSFAEDVADVASEVPGTTIAGFIDTRLAAGATGELGGLTVYALDDAATFAADHRVVCALGDNQRYPVVRLCKDAGLRFTCVVHPTASLSRSVELEEGVFVSRNVSIGAMTRIGAHTIVNRGALIGHHTRVGAFCTIGPGANIAASVGIGDSVYLGMSAVVLDRRSVGSGSIVGAGAVVTDDVPERVVTVGVPARVARSLV